MCAEASMNPIFTEKKELKKSKGKFRSVLGSKRFAEKSVSIKRVLSSADWPPFLDPCCACSTRGCRSISCWVVWGHQPVRYSCQESHHHAKGYSACQTYSWRTCLNELTGVILICCSVLVMYRRVKTEISQWRYSNIFIWCCVDMSPLLESIIQF